MSKSLITKTRISSFVIVGLLVSLLGNSFARASVPLTVVEGKKQELCPDGNGGQKSGDVDVLLLLDNSKSLNATNSPSDPENKRYEAIMVLLKALGDLTISESADGEALKLNFGLLSFGTNAKTLISLTELTTANAESLGRQVETQVPPILDKQESTTNYISAIATVLDEFSQRPNENCKVLVWFTDGQFESREINRSDPDKASKRKDQADELKSKVCGVDGFAERVRQLGINTFALVLQPTKPDERLKASYGAMQAITGVSTSMLPPQVQYGIDDYEDMCGDIRTTPLLGEVFLAQDAAEIARVVGLIDPRGNGTPVASCPSELEELEAQKMPAARHLKELTFVGRNAPTKLEDLDRAEIIDAFGIPHPLNEYLTPTSESGYRKVFVFNKKAEEKLDQGWTIKIDQGVEGWCVFVREHKFEVKFGGPNDGYEIAQVSDAGNLNDSDLQNLEFQRASDQSVLSDISEARAEAGEVRAFLSIDPTGLLFPEPIEIGVQQQSVPTISCELFSIKEIGDIRKSRRISSTCEFDTSETNLSTVTASITSSSGLAEKECNSKLFFTEPNSSGEVNDDSELTEQIELLKGKSQVVVVLEAQGDSASCVSDDSLVEFAFDVPGKGQVKIDRPVSIDLLWKKIPSPIVVWVLVFLAVLAAIILNLLLLREIKKRTAKLPNTKQYAYEVAVSLIIDASGGVTAKQVDGSKLSDHKYAIEKLIPISLSDSRRAGKLLSGSRSEIEVRLPRLWRPFDPAVMTLKSNKKVYYWPVFDRGQGLSPQTRSAIAIHTPRKESDQTFAMVTLLIPSSGNKRVELINDLLTSKLGQVCRLIKDDENWFGDRDSTKAVGKLREI
jgi:hypothetical protein